MNISIKIRRANPINNGERLRQISSSRERKSPIVRKRLLYYPFSYPQVTGDAHEQLAGGEVELLAVAEDANSISAEPPGGVVIRSSS